MLSHPLKMDCYLALIEKRHYKKFFRFLENNREHYRGVLHFIDFLKTEKDSEDFIVNSLKAMTEGKMVYWGIWNNDEIIGEVSVRDIDEEFKRGEIGYFIDKNFEGNGITSQACEILINYVFKEFDIERLVLGCDVNNTKSHKIANKFGFKLEGIARKSFIADGEFIDCSIYSLLKSEYEASKVGKQYLANNRFKRINPLARLCAYCKLWHKPRQTLAYRLGCGFTA